LLLISAAFSRAQDYYVCNTPITITSVSPGIWMAGKTYNITITGTGFDPIQDTDYSDCSAFVSLISDDGDEGLSNVAVVNSTTITATVALDADEPTQTATLHVVNCVFDSGCGPAATIPVQILGAPKIEWTQNGTTSTISVIEDGSGTAPTAQQAVVGQQIKLATKPTAKKLVSLGLAFSTNTWTAGPASGPSNNVGGYNPNSTSAHVKQTVLTKPDLTTYWLYPQSDNPLTYQYCVNIPGLSADDIANGLNCSLVAKATFNVSGPTATIVPTTTPWHVSRPIPVCNSTGKEQMLIFGKLDPKTSTTCNNVIATSGITFNATVNTLPGSSGQTEWIHVISANEITGDSVLGMPFLVNIGTGLDNFLPYNDYPDPVDATTTTASDSPDNDLGIDNASVTRTFTAKMYLMWTSQISGSIPVPLGYVKWEISGTAAANETNTPPWSLTSSAPTKRNFHISQDTGTKTHGLPTWSSLVTNTNSAAADGEQEEEQ
jgi:hypothetical protein